MCDGEQTTADRAVRLALYTKYGDAYMNTARSKANGKAPADDRSQYVALVAHELRGPLMPILNAAAILRHRPLDLDMVEYCAAIIDRQARVISRRVDDLLDVSRVQMGGLSLKRLRIPIADVVRQAVEMVEPVAGKRGMALIVNLPSTPIELDADEGRLVQALQNVLSNAVKFSNGGREIRLRAWRDAGDAIVTVTDTGIGLDAVEIQSIFALFAQCEPDVAAHTNRGLGIGLYLARTFAEAHGGSLTAASAGRGHGSTFTLRVPAVEPDSDHADTAQRHSDNRSLSFLTTA
jgi:signal transduction histidine kinase